MREPTPTEQRAMLEIEQDNRWREMIRPDATLQDYADALRKHVPGQTDQWYLDAAEGTLRGLADIEDGKVRPWHEVKEELGL